MADDIFDYFGGNSSRKVEPLDENELFDDLKKPEPAAEDESDIIADAEVELVEAPAAQAAQTASGSESGTGSAGAESSDGDEDSGEKGAHWDFLASELGIEAGAVSQIAAPESRTPKSSKPKKDKRRKKESKKPAATSVSYTHLTLPTNREV